MTLLLSIANEGIAIMLSDRRITSNGKIVDDEFNKLCVLFCDDARMAVTFTGIATYGDFNTSDWLCNTISDIGGDTGTIHNIINELKGRLSAELRRLSLGREKLTILFGGFVYGESRPQARTYQLTNWDEQGVVYDHFSLMIITPQDDCIVHVDGMGLSVEKQDKQNLKNLLGLNLPPRQLLRYCIKVMQSAAKSGKSFGLVGEQINTAIIHASPDTVVNGTFHSSKFVNYFCSPNMVVTKGMIVLGSFISTNGILAGPEIKKKQTCWCGSGLMFKNCHLRKFGSALVNTNIFREPMSPFFRFEKETSQASGKIFMMSGGIN
jgi:hypothetical protein